jgi:low temperature requirement protein LtrA
VNRRASNLELFLDLVFVFAVTQITGEIGRNLTIAGVLKAALIGFLIWWQWTAFTWAGTAIDIQGEWRARTLVLGMVPAMLVMAVAAPRSLDNEGIWFAGTYSVVQLFVVLLHGVTLLVRSRTAQFVSPSGRSQSP